MSDTEKTNEKRAVLIDILSAALNGTEAVSLTAEQQTQDQMRSLYHLAKKHSVANVVLPYLRAYQEPDTELSHFLKYDEFRYTLQFEKKKYAYQQICDTFNHAGIAYIPLKGALIRPFYPKEQMRTSCDIDILVHEADLEAAIDTLIGIGYERGKRNFHDVSLYSPTKVHLELHFHIGEHIQQLDSVLKNAWDYAIPAGQSQYKFTDEFFIFQILAHMAYHFLHGGCGIRSLMDIWVIEHNMGISYQAAQPLLKKAGIDRFAEEMHNLAERCFTDQKKDDDGFYDSLLNYIFNGGVYGSQKNHVAVQKAEHDSQLLYTMRRIFMSYDSMVYLYPILRKLPWLLPFCWIARAIKAVVSGKSKRVMSEFLCAANTSRSNTAEIRAICSRLGL